jgi:hypothetical protein
MSTRLSGACSAFAARPGRAVTVKNKRRERPTTSPVSHSYSNQDTTIATAAAAIVAVASQPITCSASGNVNPAMTDRRMVRRIIMTITGTATTPFSTALQ